MIEETRLDRFRGGFPWWCVGRWFNRRPLNPVQDSGEDDQCEDVESPDW